MLCWALAPSHLRSLRKKGVVLIPTCKEENLGCKEMKQLVQSHQARERQFLNTALPVSEVGALTHNILGHDIHVFSWSTAFTPVTGGQGE